MLFDRFKNLVKKKFGSLVLLTAFFAIGVFVGQNYEFPLQTNKDLGSQRLPLTVINKDKPDGINADFSLFWDAWNRVTASYLERDKIDPQKLVYGAISGLVSSLEDPYTVFLNPEQNSGFKEELSGSYEGVGIQIGYKNKKLVVIAPLDNTPAEKKGILAGEEVLKVNDKETDGKTLPEVVSLIRGPSGSEVKLQFRKPDGMEYEAVLKREKIEVKSVKFSTKDDNLAYIRLSRFGDTLKEEWSKSIEEVSKGNFNGLILDLRDNPGGHLESSVHVVSDFVPSGSTVVIQEDADGKKIPFKSRTQAQLSKLPVVVLVNKGSASASEIVAGALRDLGRAKIIGEKTFGKGTVQEVQELGKGSGLHITISKWLTPKGTWVNATEGLEPDIKVDTSAGGKEEEITAGKDPILDKALEILNGRK